MRRQLAAILAMVLLLSLACGVSASAAPSVADPPEKVALDFFNATRFGSAGVPNGYVLAASGDLGAQLAGEVKARFGGWPDVSVGSVWQVDAVAAEVFLGIKGDPWTLALTLTRAAPPAGGPWLVSGFRFALNYRIDHEDLQISVSPGEETAGGTVSLTLTMLSGYPAVNLRCYTGLKVSGAEVDGQPVDVVQRDNGLVVTMQDAIPGQTYVFSCDFAGTIDDKDSFRRRAYMDILPQGAYFGDIFGADFLGNPTEADVAVSVPTGWTVVTAGAPLPPDGAAASGRQEFRFHREPGTSTLITVGKYTPFASTIQGIPVSWYLMPEHAAQTDLVASITDRALAFALSHFGPDPYSDLTIAEIPPQHGGGTTSRNMIMVVPHLTRGLSARDPRNWDGVVTHEILHQWWSRGTNQFCYESLVNYAVDWMMGETDPAALRASRAYHLKSYLTVPPGEEKSILQSKNLYTDKWLFPIIYDKGAMVYGMLRAEIRDEAFEQTIREFFTSSDRSPERLQAIAEQAYGHDLDWFFRQWLDTTGRLDLSIEFAWRQKAADGYHTSIRIINDGPIEVHHVPILIRTAAGDMRQIANLGPTGEVMSMVTESPVTDIILDPDGVFLDVDPRNNVIGSGLFDRGSPGRPWLFRSLTVVAVAGLALLQVRRIRRRDKRLILRRLAAHFGFTYLPSRDNPRLPDLLMSAARTFGAASLAHHVDGDFPCAFGIYRGRLAVLRAPGAPDLPGTAGTIRIALHFPHDGAAFAICRRSRWGLPWRLRRAVDPAFDRRFSLRVESGEGGLTLDARARAAVVALGRTGAAGIRVTPFGALYYAKSPLTTTAASAALDALAAIADSLAGAVE